MTIKQISPLIQDKSKSTFSKFQNSAKSAIQQNKLQKLINHKNSPIEMEQNILSKINLISKILKNQPFIWDKNENAKKLYTSKM